MTGAPAVQLLDGRSIPRIGLGVYKVSPSHTAGLVADAIRAGYRHVDTAKLYGNEREVGEGVRASGVDRDEVFVTTKVWNDDHGYDATLRAFDRSVGLLGFETIDLYLIHWPMPSKDRYVETWRALERLHEDGRARSIGVSNFAIPHLERLAAESGTVPVVNQVELHPRLPQTRLRAYHDAHGIRTEAWSPLARGGLLGDPVLQRLAERHGRSTAQIVLRWHVQQGVIAIPKSDSIERVRENADVFDFALTDADLAEIAQLADGARTGRDPELD